MVYCEECGTKIAKDAIHCEGCGKLTVYGKKKKEEEAREKEKEEKQRTEKEKREKEKELKRKEKIREEKKRRLIKKIKKPNFYIPSVIIILVLGILFLPIKTISYTTYESYQVQEPYQVQESYQVTVPYYKTLKYTKGTVRDKVGCYGDFDLCLECWRVVTNTDNEGGTFNFGFVFYMGGKVYEKSTSKYIRAGETVTISKSDYRYSFGDSHSCTIEVIPPTLTKQRTEMRTRTVTKYRTVTKQRKVRKEKWVNWIFEFDQYWGIDTGIKEMR